MGWEETKRRVTKGILVPEIVCAIKTVRLENILIWTVVTVSNVL